MIFVKIDAGLANQIYKFATAYALSKEWDEELVLDPVLDKNPLYAYLLDEFQLPEHKKVVYPVRYNRDKGFSAIDDHIKKDVAVINESFFEWDENYLTIPKEKFYEKFPDKQIYLEGAFFIRQMFLKYIEDIRKFIVLKKPSSLVASFEQKNRDVITVGVHVRKTGFVVSGIDHGFDYYKAAIVYMRKKFENVRFYIFSDQQEIAKEGLGAAEDIFYIDAMNGLRGDIEEFICLTKCDHYILTRVSTYGRMAEILNSGENKHSVIFGENTHGDSEERYHYMSLEEMKKLSMEYRYQEIDFDFSLKLSSEQFEKEPDEAFAELSLDSGRVTTEDKKKIIFLKAKAYAGRGCFGEAVHLCSLLENQYQFEETGFHDFYGDVLYRFGRKREAAVEYLKGADAYKYRNALREYSYHFTQKKKKHFLIVQYQYFDSQYYSELEMLGIILGRMGHAVSFLLKRDRIGDRDFADNVSDLEKGNRSFNSKFMDVCLEKGFCRDQFSYRHLCYDYDIVIKNTRETIKEIAESVPDCEMILLGRDSEIFSLNMPYRKIFVDFSEPFDEAYLAEKIGKSKIQKIYQAADIIITGDEMLQIHGGQQRITPDKNLLEKSRLYVEEDIPYYLPTVYTEDYLDIAWKIQEAI